MGENDTIVAVSSPAGGVRSIVRLTGPETLSICKQVFRPAVADATHSATEGRYGASDGANVILPGSVYLADELRIDVRLYLFFAPHSYTGEPLAEIHLHASPILVEALVQNLLARGLRAAGPGEFTARAYLNGKLDLAQAEAVNEVISSSNRLQLRAAETLLSGQLTKATEKIRAAMLDLLSLMEAGLDFSGEDIEFISPEQAAERLTEIRSRLEELLAGSIRCETLLDLPAIGIAGAPNAGKSSLLNALLGWERSIVSRQPRTTRDVLNGVLTTERFQCVLFDCAGLVTAPDNVLDELAQRAAVEALHHCLAVIFCVDATKPDLSEDRAIRTLIQPRNAICAATKSDLLAQEALNEKIRDLNKALDTNFLAISSRTGLGLKSLLNRCESLIADDGSGTQRESAVRNPQSEISVLALTARHKQAVTEAIENIRQAITEVNRGRDEVAVMMIRAAHQAISEIEQQPLDEQVLDRIFSRFCIGK